MMLRKGNLQFHFSGALDAFKFDEEDKSQATYHGLSHCMKAVDFIVEYEDHYLFVEIKDPPHEETEKRYADDAGKELVDVLVRKFRDTCLYRWAEDKLDKPVRYRCVVELNDTALLCHIMDQLKRKLPEVNLPDRWQRPLVQSCIVCNTALWNENFPENEIRRDKARAGKRKTPCIFRL